VKYHRLLDIGRKVVDARVPRPLGQRLVRAALKEALPRSWIFRPAVAIGQMMRPLLPQVLADKVPTAAAGQSRAWPEKSNHPRRMLALAGCVQPGLAPNTNAATARLLDKLGITLFEAPAAGCCGALRYHLDAHEQALDDMRRNIDAWWPHIEAGVEAIVMTASGCGAHVKEYGHLLQHDPAYAAKATRVAELTLDVAEILVAEADHLKPLLAAKQHPPLKLAFHSPCTLQHAQKIKGVVEELLQAAGVELTPVPDSHLCCGSAGTYSILQPALSKQLRDNKLAALTSGSPTAIATANIGCQTHLQSGCSKPVRHWVEVIEERL
jgi:glycolate oxidase iron-sulfur subunit